jgi:hypothetical protein
MGASNSQEGAGQLIWIVTPLATALLLRAFACDGWGDFKLLAGQTALPYVSPGPGCTGFEREFYKSYESHMTYKTYGR